MQAANNPVFRAEGEVGDLDGAKFGHKVRFTLTIPPFDGQSMDFQLTSDVMDEFCDKQHGNGWKFLGEFYLYHPRKHCYYSFKICPECRRTIAIPIDSSWNGESQSPTEKYYEEYHGKPVPASADIAI